MTNSQCNEGIGYQERCNGNTAKYHLSMNSILYNALRTDSQNALCPPMKCGHEYLTHF